ncbi:MAG: cyclic nucleotide-binding domain-containing protein [Acidobacteriota bacterium]
MDARYVELVASFPVFHGYTPYGLGLMLDRGVIKELSRGDILYSEGELAASVGLVIAGTLDLFITIDGGERLLGQAGSSRLLGELAALAAVNRVMSARATGPAVVVQWDAEVFRRLLSDDAQLSQRVFRETFRSIVEERKSLIASLAAARRPSDA